MGQNFAVGGLGIWVTALGAYDDDNLISFGSAKVPVTVGIFNNVAPNRGQLVTSVATFTGSGSGVVDGDVLYQAITPVYLAPGSYCIATAGYSGVGSGYEEFGNSAHPPYSPTPPWTINTSGVITLGDVNYNRPIGTLVYPDLNSGPANSFAAYSFRYQVATSETIPSQDTPAMPSWALGGIGALLAAIGTHFLPRKNFT